MQEMRMMERVKRTYMQDMPESAHHDSASTDSLQSVIKISKCYRTLVEGSNSTQVTKGTEECYADLMSSLTK